MSCSLRRIGDFPHDRLDLTNSGTNDIGSSNSQYGRNPFENLFLDILSAVCPSTAEEYFGTDNTPIAISLVTDVAKASPSNFVCTFESAF
jgi:hypothetical protein